MTNAKLLSVGKGSFVLKNSGRTEKEVPLALGGEERFSRLRRMRLNGRLYRAQKEDISTLRPVEPAPSIAADFLQHNRPKTDVRSQHLSRAVERCRIAAGRLRSRSSPPCRRRRYANLQWSLSVRRKHPLPRRSNPDPTDPRIEMIRMSSRSRVGRSPTIETTSASPRRQSSRQS